MLSCPGEQCEYPVRNLRFYNFCPTKCDDVYRRDYDNNNENGIKDNEEWQQRHRTTAEASSVKSGKFFDKI